MLESIISSQLTLSAFLICTFTSIVLGIGIALVGMYRSRSSQSYAVALAILPVAVQLVIMLVNGNVGAGVAVAGAFSLVRFRSVPGTARCSWRWPSALQQAWAMSALRSYRS